ncbi:MAG: DNA cytosine methyltransferase [Bacteroidota bacterium]
MASKLKVIDFFSGAGGFSEGFRQAGFDVILAIDNWQIAVDTHNENHPDGLAIKDDVIRISNLPDNDFHKLIPDTEVIIGSPPCTDFSNSNKSGNGDKSKGIELVEAYLRIVARKKFKRRSKLKYWILENVPKIQNHIQESYSAKDLGLKGLWSLIVMSGNSGVYNAKYFGVPSNRKRYFCGEFPEPKRTIDDDSKLILLKDIIQALGAPKEKLHQKILDPIYNIKLAGEDVSDHHYTQLLSDFEKKKAKRLKQDKGYMGKMSFPENPEKPARTIMATMSFTSRECFVLGDDYSKLRAPTIREVASLMSFPIDYKFYGSSLGTKYRMIGNAVPPKMAIALAKGILNKERKNIILNGYQMIRHPQKLAFSNLNFNEIPIKEEKPKKVTARFKYHIPYFKFETYRVELTNHHSDFNNLNFKWTAEIHYNQGKEKAKKYTPSLDHIGFDKTDLRTADKLFTMSIRKKIVNPKEFQRFHCMTAEEVKQNQVLEPYAFLEQVREFLDKSFQFDRDHNHVLVAEAPGVLPTPIAIGYYILKRFTQLMENTNE